MSGEHEERTHVIEQVSWMPGPQVSPTHNINAVSWSPGGIDASSDVAQKLDYAAEVEEKSEAILSSQSSAPPAAAKDEGDTHVATVEVPPGVRGGDVLEMEGPDGHVHHVTVPLGMKEGMSFRVAIADIEEEEEVHEENEEEDHVVLAEAVSSAPQSASSQQEATPGNAYPPHPFAPPTYSYYPTYPTPSATTLSAPRSAPPVSSAPLPSPKLAAQMKEAARVQEEGMKIAMQMVRPTCEEDARSMAQSFGFKLGTNGIDFASASYRTKGLYAVHGGSNDGCAFFGLGGTDEEMTGEVTRPEEYRLTPPPPPPSPFYWPFVPPSMWNASPSTANTPLQGIGTSRFQAAADQVQQMNHAMALSPGHPPGKAPPPAGHPHHGWFFDQFPHLGHPPTDVEDGTEPGDLPLTQAEAEKMAKKLGLKLGREGKTFAAGYKTKGLYAYKEDCGTENSGCAFFGTGGTAEQMRGEVQMPNRGQYRPTPPHVPKKKQSHSDNANTAGQTVTKPSANKPRSQEGPFSFLNCGSPSNTSRK